MSRALHYYAHRVPTNSYNLPGRLDGQHRDTVSPLVPPSHSCPYRFLLHRPFVDCEHFIFLPGASQCVV